MKKVHAILFAVAGSGICLLATIQPSLSGREQTLAERRAAVSDEWMNYRAECQDNLARADRSVGDYAIAVTCTHAADQFFGL